MNGWKHISINIGKLSLWVVTQFSVGSMLNFAICFESNISFLLHHLWFLWNITISSLCNIWEQLEEEEKVKQQEEAEQNRQRMMQVASMNLVTNTEQFECPVCFTDVEPNEGVKLRECLHEICRWVRGFHVCHES